MKTLIFGDFSPTERTNPLFKKKAVDALFHDTVSLFRESDVNFVNLEVALTDSDAPIQKFGPPLKACAEAAECLRDIGVNICGLSNNHIFDYGIRGARDTIATLDRLGILHTGFGENAQDARKNLVIEQDGQRLCFIAVCEHEYSYALENRMGARVYDEYDTMEDIREARKTADRVIVIYHGGKEQCHYPSPRLRKLCRSMIKNGADAVICQHSHCIGCYEKFEGGHILYGQGNFHFVGPANVRSYSVPSWNECLAVQYDTKTGEMSFVPVVTKDAGVALAQGEAKDRILREFAERNQELADGRWRERWHEFCEAVRPNYTKAAQTAAGKSGFAINECLFAHYLDCEAHSDVWRELFYTVNHVNEIPGESDDVLKAALQERQLPPLRSREEMKTILQREIYGFLPETEYTWTVSEEEFIEKRLAKGTVHYSKVEMTLQTPRGSHTFPIYRLMHTDGKKRPVILYNDIHPTFQSRYFPLEELAGYEVDILRFCYTDLTSDDGDFTTGVAPLLLPNGQETDTDCGKIPLWAWCAMRVADYALTLPTTDENNLMISGHSRLGKTALFTGMMDERFRFTFSNMAGCAGDSLAHGSRGLRCLEDPELLPKGETITAITNRFPYWFCKNYNKYREENISHEFDQHFLLAAICPRYVLIGTASMDLWADPPSQQLCCAAAGEAWEKEGLDGYIGTRFLSPGGADLKGHVGCFMIDSKHYMSRLSWARATEFIRRHK